jgi:hypothetical protein
MLRDEGLGDLDDEGEPITYGFGMLPATTNQSFLDRYFYGEIPGLAQGLARTHYSVMEGEGIVPGHVQGLFSGNTGLTVVIDGQTVENATTSQVITSAVQGYINFADVADQLTEFANTHVQAMTNEINFMLDAMIARGYLRGTN